MENKTQLPVLLLVLLAASFVIAGCIAEDNGFQEESYRWQRESFGNLTDGQRQQLMQERLTTAKKACEGMNEGEVCSISAAGRFRRNGNATSTEDNRTVEGSCETREGILQCRTEFRQPPTQEAKS